MAELLRLFILHTHTLTHTCDSRYVHVTFTISFINAYQCYLAKNDADDDDDDFFTSSLFHFYDYLFLSSHMTIDVNAKRNRKK